MAEPEARVKVRPQEEQAGAIYTERMPDPCILVIFGATGDLTERKLIPALYQLARNDSLPEAFTVVGMARRELDDDSYRERMREATRHHSRSGVDEEVWRGFAQRLHYVRGDFSEEGVYDRLEQRLSSLEEELDTQGNRLFYLAVPPGIFPMILENLQDAGLFRDNDGEEPWARVVVEKPFGHDLNSARELNRKVSQVLDESQVFRIDHYLGKETVQNILVFRFGNAIFEPIWNRKYIDHVQITAAEEIGLEGRGGFYDGEGVVRDMVQNHMLQLLSLSAMEAPVSFGADDIRDEKVQVLRSLRPIVGDADVRRNTVHGQYLGYHGEERVDPDSRTPTYVALRAHIDNWRWQGVPFYLRTGKRLKKRRTEVSIHFQHIPLCLFGMEEVCQPIQPNVLTMRIQPDEGIQLCFTTKVPGEDLTVGGVTMDFSYEDAFSRELLEAYERLILDCMRGDATLFARRDEIEWAWRFVTPIIEGWENDEDSSLGLYRPGSPGPREAEELLSEDGRSWEAL